MPTRIRIQPSRAHGVRGLGRMLTHIGIPASRRSGDLPHTLRTMTAMTNAMDATVRPILPGDVDAVVRLCIEHAAFEQAVFCADGKIEDLSRALFATEP